MAKILCLFVVLVCASLIDGKLDESLLTEEMKETMEKIHKTCLEETEIDEDVIKNAAKGEIEEDNKKLKCYMKCVMKTTGTMDEDGNIDPEPIMKLLPESYKEPIKAMMEKCTKYSDEDLCERAYNMLKCAHDEDSKHFFLI